MPYLIDGHNVVAALPDIDLEEEHDEAKLILKLRAWAGRVRRKAVVVFDGGIPGGYAHALSNTEVKVVFAARHHTNADRIIKERLEHLPDAANWTVVSSDWEVLDHARQVGARVLSAQAFTEQLTQSAEAEMEKPERISAEELAAWLKIFPEEETGQLGKPKMPPGPPRQRPVQKPKTGQTSLPTTPRVSRSTKQSGRGHTTRSLGVQVGYEPKTPDVPPADSEKPEDVSEAEMQEWLAIFHDEPPEASSKPAVKRSRAAPSSRRSPAESSPPAFDIKKEDDSHLSAKEVAEWMALFGNPDDPEPGPPPKPAVPKKKRKRSSRLREHQHRVTKPELPSSDDLSEEDRQLWLRMFGEEE